MNIQGRVKLPTQNIVFQYLLPPLVHWGLAISDQPHTLFHQSPNVEVIGVPGVSSNDPAPPSLLDGGDHFIYDLRDVCLQHQRLFHLMDY